MASLLQALRQLGAGGAAANARAEIDAAHRQAVQVAVVAHRVNRRNVPVAAQIGSAPALQSRAA